MIRTALISLLLAGCVSMSHVPSVTIVGDPVPVTVCMAERDNYVESVIRDVGRDISFNFSIIDLPDEHRVKSVDYAKLHEYDDGAAERSALLFLKVIPECPIIVMFGGSGSAAGCLGAAAIGYCWPGYTRRNAYRLDAVIVLRIRTRNLIEHELLHALGCDHDDAPDICTDKISRLLL